MSELLISLLAALLGVALDRLNGWFHGRSARNTALARDRLQRRVSVDRINQRIDREIADEKDLGALIDRL